MKEVELEVAMSGERTCVEQEAFEIRCAVGRGYAGVSPIGAPVFVFPISAGALPAGRRMGQVRTSFHSSVSFVFQRRSWSQPAAVLECLDRRLLRTFCCVGADLAERLSDAMTARQLLDALRSWDELLRKRDQLSAAQELGLWGELTLLLRCPNVDGAVAGWHGPASHTMDFHGGGVALECKTSVHRRRHQVSLDQADHVGAIVDSYLISLWAQEDSTGGKTLTRLVEDVASRVSDSVSLHKKLLMVGYREEHEYTRRWGLVDEVRLYDMEQIPRVKDWDQGVSKIKYEVDLSRLTPLGDDALVSVLERLCRESEND